VKKVKKHKVKMVSNHLMTLVVKKKTLVVKKLKMMKFKMKFKMS
jgi:hypothetical protein